MTVRQCRKLQRYADSLKPLLGLESWEVEVLPDPPSDPSNIAECCTPFGRSYVSIRYSEVLFEDNTPLAFVMECTIHELLHATRAQSRHVVEAVGGSKKLLEAYVVAEEYEVDRLTTALMRSLPEFAW